MTAIMPARPTRQRETDSLAPVERHLSAGDWQAALDALLPELDSRPSDRAATLAARLLRALDPAPAKPDALAAALDRLVALTEHQDAQIRALQAMLENRL